MKKFYTYIFFFFIFILSIYFGINNGEKIIRVTDKNLVGEYILNCHKNKDFYYKLILKKNNCLILIKGSGNKDIFKKEGKWYIMHTNDKESIITNIPGFNSLDFSLGDIKMNLFTSRIKIEAFSMGEFLGKEDDAFFIQK